MFEWIKQHFREQDKCVHAVGAIESKFVCKWSSVLVGLWIQVSNVSFRMWWLKANLGKGHWWEVEVSLCPLLSETSSFPSFLGLAQFTFLGSRNSSPHSTLQKAGLLPLTRAFVSSWSEDCGVGSFSPAIGLCFPRSCSHFLCGILLHQAVSLEVSFTGLSSLEITGCSFQADMIEDLPAPSFIEIKLTWNIIFLLRAWHDDLIYAYIAKWSLQ